MIAVDKTDQMRRTYSTQRRSPKWWFPLFTWMLDVAAINAWALYQLRGDIIRKQLLYKFSRPPWDSFGLSSMRNTECPPLDPLRFARSIELSR